MRVEFRQGLPAGCTEWLNEHVGKQGWDWNWGMADTDATENRLTIKIRQKYAKYATIATLRWT